MKTGNVADERKEEKKTVSFSLNSNIKIWILNSPNENTDQAVEFDSRGWRSGGRCGWGKKERQTIKGNYILQKQIGRRRKEVDRLIIKGRDFIKKWRFKEIMGEGRERERRKRDKKRE